MPHKTSAASGTISKSRLMVGGAVFIAGFLSPLLIVVVANSDLSTGTKTLLSGALAFGIPEVGMLLAVMILGRDGFVYLKQTLVQFVRRNFVPPKKVSRTRYRVGLLMIALPLFCGWLAPYLGDYIFGDNKLSWIVALTGDVIFLAGLFVLGGDFWDKLRALFRYEVSATIPEQDDKFREE